MEHINSESKPKMNPKPDSTDTSISTLKFESDMKKYETIETLASVSHDAWQYWSMQIMKDLDELIVEVHALNQLLLDADVVGYKCSKTHQTAINLIKKHNERNDRWQKQWVAYKNLPEEVRETDRIWAKKAYKVLGEKPK